MENNLGNHQPSEMQMTSAYQMVGITSKHQQAGGPTELTGDHQP